MTSYEPSGFLYDIMILTTVTDASSRFASRFEEKKVCQTPFYRVSLEAVEARIDAPIKGIEVKQKKHFPSPTAKLG
jgi:hypothetical protein